MRRRNVALVERSSKHSPRLCLVAGISAKLDRVRLRVGLSSPDYFPTGSDQLISVTDSAGSCRRSNFRPLLVAIATCDTRFQPDRCGGGSSAVARPPAGLERRRTHESVACAPGWTHRFPRNDCTRSRGTARGHGRETRRASGGHIHHVDWRDVQVGDSGCAPQERPRHFQGFFHGVGTLPAHHPR